MTNTGFEGTTLFLNYGTETRTTVGNKNDSMTRMFSGYPVVRPTSPGGKLKEFCFKTVFVQEKRQFLIRNTNIGQ
jgi:hypothetical protein